MSFTFNVTNLEELITAAGIIEDDQIITITGKQLKETAVVCVKIQDDLNQCHQLLDEIGVPKSNTGLDGIKQRLEALKFNGLRG